MSAPRRLLLDEAASPAARELVADWVRNAQPPADGRAKTLAALGLAGGAAALTGGASGVTAALTPKAAAAASVTWLKWIALAGAVVAVTGGAATMALTSRSPSVTSSSVSTHVEKTVSPRSTAPVEVAAPPASVVAPSLDVASLPASHASARSLRSAPIAHAEGGRGDTLRLELAALDDAHAALADGDAARALRAVDAYEAHFPRGTFVQEAEVLRVEGLARSGDRVGARRAAERFAARFPKSPHLARVSALASPTP